MKPVEQCFRGDEVRVFRLNAPAVLDALRAAASRLLSARPEVLEVRLFGSLARNQALPGSDADLLVVVRSTALPFRDRPPVYARYFEGAGMACDVFVYTEAELGEAEAPPVARQALDEGTVLAARRKDRAGGG